MRIFDFHTHTYPSVPLPKPVDQARDVLRNTWRPLIRRSHDWAWKIHEAPNFVRRPFEEVAPHLLLSHLFLEGSADDLAHTMRENQVGGALVVAHPPAIPNRFVSKTCHKDSRLIAAWQLPTHSWTKVELFWDEFRASGSRVLKIHPMSDGRGPDDDRYLQLLRLAERDGVLVVLHTGVFQSHVMFRRPKFGDFHFFMPWFREFPKLKFVLAHFNLFQPEELLAETDWPGNVYFSTSWQKTETLKSAVQKFGARRLLFSSDWPLIGENMAVQLQRWRDAFDQLETRQEDREFVFSGNAKMLLSETGAWKGAW